MPSVPTAETTAQWHGAWRKKGSRHGRQGDEELCKWHDEQVAKLESQDATPGAARAIEMHAKTSVALLEAMAEIRRRRSDVPRRAAAA